MSRDTMRLIKFTPNPKPPAVPMALRPIVQKLARLNELRPDKLWFIEGFMDKVIADTEAWMEKGGA